jgi:hypothetical protein
LWLLGLPQSLIPGGVRTEGEGLWLVGLPESLIVGGVRTEGEGLWALWLPQSIIASQAGGPERGGVRHPDLSEVRHTSTLRG